MRILATRRFPGPAWDALRDVEYADGALAAAGRRPGIEAVAVVAERVDDEILDLFPDLRLVANYGVGYDGIDVDACGRRGVAVTNTPHALGIATADLTLALLLAARRRVVEGDRFVRDGRWGSDWVEGALLGEDVTGATLGIVGLGRIGMAVARRARGFEMRILYAKRSRLVPEEERELAVDHRELDDLLRESDVVTLHVPLTEETRSLLDARRLRLLRDAAALINTSRGQLVDEGALVAELASGRLRAGLDVFAHEPNVPPELVELPNVVLTPHVGSATQAAREAATRELVDNLLAAAEGRPLPNPVYPV